MQLRRAAAVAAVPVTALALAASLAGPAGAQTRGPVLTATLTGGAEVPGPGDPDGSGTARITVLPGAELLCYELAVEDVATPTGAHVHIGSVTEAGGVVVHLVPPTGGFSSDCTFVERELAVALIRSPEDYYVNVHNAQFPAGAVRGQLERDR